MVLQFSPFHFAVTFHYCSGTIKSPVTLLFVMLICSINCRNNSNLNRSDVPAPRILSFAPSITETVYALNLQRHLVGVTDFCTWPSEAAELPKVGGYINPNYEQILRLKPDIAILLKEHETLISFLGKHEIEVVAIGNENLQGIYRSIMMIAEACNVPQRGDSLVRHLQQGLRQTRYVSNVKPKILFCIGRDRPGSGNIGVVFCAGPKSFYNEIIHYAGGQNAYTDSLIVYPSVAGEGILRLAPDIIIDVMAANKGMEPEKVRGDWDALPMLPAVKIGAVYALNGSYVSIPGPRVAEICNDIRNCIQDWQLRTARGSACLRSR